MTGKAAAAMLALLLIPQAGEAMTIPPGKSALTWTDPKNPERPLRVFTYRPARCPQPCTLVFSIHGVSRTASNYRDNWEAAAERYHLAIVAPEFSRADWPRYNEVDVVNEPADRWAFGVIERLFDAVAEGRKDYVIFGHSAGGQFVHRMAYFMPESRARVMVAANPGKEKGVDPFPYSLVGTRFGAPAVRQALQRNFVLALGEKDTDPNHADLRRNAATMKQGTDRAERGRNYFDAAAAAARELGVKSNWQLLPVPDSAHQASRMTRAVADHLFGSQ
jgi:poly(3-hydroxybutyrate) depolymerase